ncbi:MAG: hypothetical protein AAGG80_05705 [Pseudomonadota bacterium]
MSIYTRSDKFNFILQPYREILKLKNPNLLKKEIRLLAKNNGAYIRLFKLSGQRYEVVFSRDPGQLLGESIWHYFHKPNYLIFCEALPNEKHFILVIVIDNRVLLDAKLTKAQLLEELQSISEIEKEFMVQLIGNVPIALNKDANQFQLKSSQIAKLSRLQDSVIERLLVDEKLQLLPLEQAIKWEKIGDFRKLSAFIVFFLLVLIGAGYYFWDEDDANIKVQIVDPYQLYKKNLMTPAPNLEINNIMNVLIKLNTLPGWTVTKLNFTRTNGFYNVRSVGGKVNYFYEWARANHLTTKFNTNGLQVNLPMKLMPRPLPDKIYDAEHTVTILVDKLMSILPGKALQISTIKRQNHFQEINIKIIFNEISPDVVKLIALQLQDMPVTFESMTAAQKNGMLAGSISLKVLGK